MSLLFYLFTLAMQFVASEMRHRTANVTAVFVNNQHGIKRRGQDFDKKSLYLKGYTSKRLTDEFPEKSWTMRGVNKLYKKLRDTGTVNRRPDSGRPHSVRIEDKKPSYRWGPRDAGVPVEIW